MRVANIAVGDGDSRWPLVLDWLKRQRPDVVTLQKTGGKEEASLQDDLCRAGYEGWFCDHRKHYLGVAILAGYRFLSRHNRSPKILDRELSGDDPYERRFRSQARFLTVSIGNLWISSVYAPYGPERLGKWGAIRRRAAWLTRLRDHVCSADHESWLLCGDFNVKADGPPWKGNLYSRCEKDALGELDFRDLYRKAHPAATECRGFTRGCSENDRAKGSRLHLVLASKSLEGRLQSAHVDVESKPWPRDDAPPLVVDLDAD